MDADYDNDGLTNGEEIKLGCNYMSIDTDGDGLSDYVELLAGTDPLSVKTDGKKDADKDFKNVIEDVEGVTLTMRGKANVYSTTIQVTNLDRLYMPCFVSDIYELNCDGSFDQAKFEKLDSKFDAKSNVISAKLEHFSKYVVIDDSRDSKAKPNVYILIDNSGSMYSDDLCPGSDENDVDFKRVDMTQTLIKRLDKKCRIGVAKFTATYRDMSEGFDKSAKELNTLVEEIRTVR